jgi:hypothetical protein
LALVGILSTAADRPTPPGYLAKRVQLGVGFGVRVLLRDLRAEFDVFPEACRNGSSAGRPAVSAARR